MQRARNRSCNNESNLASLPTSSHIDFFMFWKQHLCELRWPLLGGPVVCLRQLHRTMWHVVPGHLDLHSAGWPGSLHGKEWSANLPLDLARTRLASATRGDIMDGWVGSIDPGMGQKMSESIGRLKKIASHHLIFYWIIKVASWVAWFPAMPHPRSPHGRRVSLRRRSMEQCHRECEG